MDRSGRAIDSRRAGNWPGNGPGNTVSRSLRATSGRPARAAQAVMLVTPGQGIVTLLIGLLLMNFPGKYRVERWLVLQPGVLRGLNWLRQKRGHQPFDAPL